MQLWISTRSGRAQRTVRGRALWLCGALLAALIFAGPTAIARAADTLPLGGTLTVRVTSGREFRGWMHERTTTRQLWLQSGSGAMSVLRPIDWSRIVDIETPGKIWPVAQFKAAAMAAAARADQDPFRDDPQQPAAQPVKGKRQSVPEPADKPESEPIRSLDVQVELGHWNAGTEASGLLVMIQPLDAAGQPQPVSGTLELSLHGQRFVPLVDGEQFPELARWTHMVANDDFTAGRAVYSLPFQALHPEFNVDLGTLGLVHARLTVPGEGVFEASSGAVAIRQPNAVRDRLQTQQSGQRFFYDELTGRGETFKPSYFWAQPGTY